MALETKVILAAIGEVMHKSKDLEEAYESVRAIANVEGVILKPFRSEKEKGDCCD